jgi:hypothetical protein
MNSAKVHIRATEASNLLKHHPGSVGKSCDVDSCLCRLPDSSVSTLVHLEIDA